MDSKTVQYECSGPTGRTTATVDLAAVLNVLDTPLAPEVSAVFITAAGRAGITVAGVDYVSVEAWPSLPQPWPVYVAIGGAIMAEFYPVGFFG
jgi:hypothetical protein